MNSRNIRILILIVFTIILTICDTSLSTNNCPSNFNMTIANVTTGIGTGELTKFFFSAYMQATQQAKIQSYIISSNTKQVSNITTGQYIWPYVAIGVLFTLSFVILVLCMVFQKSCPPCQSWRRDFSKRPYQLSQIRCVALFGMIFSIGILATSIAAFTIIPAAQTNLQYTKCGIYGTLDVALNGDDQKWGGFSHIKDQVGNISKLLNSTNSQINNFFVDDTTIKDAMQNMKANNIQIFTSNKDAKVKTPDPYAAASALMTDSWFIETFLGSTSQPATMTNDIQQGLNITKQLSDQANSIIKSAFIIVQSSATITSNTASSQRALSMYQNQLNTFQQNLNTFSNNYFDPIFNWGIYVVEVFVGFVLVASLAVIIGSISIHFLNIYDCRHFLHFGWVVYGLTYFGIIFTVYFLLPMGSVGYTFCQYYGNMLQNETEYNKIGQAYSQNILNRLDTCVLGDGNILTKFSIQREMNTVSKLFININSFNSMNDMTNSLYVNQSISLNKIGYWVDALQKYKVGITKDVDTSLLTDANAVRSLTKLNQFTLWTPAVANDPIPRCSRDVWVYDIGDCTNAQYHWIPGNQTQGQSIDMTLDTCISLQQKYSISSPSIWTLSDIQKRYKQFRGTCPVAYDKINEYGNAIINYRDSRTNLFQGMIDQLTNLQNLHYAFNITLDDFRSSLSSFSSTQTIVDLNNLVTNKIDGLLVSSNCSPIGDRMKFIYNAFCVNTIGNVVQLGICMLVLLCLMIGGIFTACVFAQRTATIKRLGQIQDKKLQVFDNSIHSQTFARKEKSQTSSSQSDED